MKVHLTNFLCAALTSTVVLLSASQTAVAAADPRFIKFAMDQAHNRGFHGCDKAISDIFKDAGGDDIRVIAGAIPALKTDSIRMTATYGKPGDTIYVDAVIRRVGTVCYTTQTAVLVFNESCDTTSSDNTYFKVVQETLGNIFLRNAGGVDLILRPIEKGCLATYIIDQTF